MPMNRFGRTLGLIFVGSLVLLGFAPAVVVALASISDTEFLTFPPRGFSLDWYAKALTDDRMVESFQLSIGLAIASSLISVVLGIMASFAIVRYEFPGKTLIEAFVMAPLSFPNVVLGLALLQVISQVGIRTGFATLLIGHIVVITPYAVRLISASMAGRGRTLERAAASLGASGFTILRTVSLPQVKSGIIGALIFTAITSFDEVSMTLFLSGIRSTTVPVRLYTYAEQFNTPLIAATSTILVLIGAAAIVLIDRTVGLSRAFGAGDLDDRTRRRRSVRG